VTALEVVRAGPLTTVQDLGRPGWAHLGVPRSGAVDVPALRAANRLVGNPPGTAGLETTLRGCAVRVDVERLVAVTGARADVTVDGAPVPQARVVPVPAGAVLDVGSATAGVRSYVAVAGGLAVEPVLGSRATDTLSGLGPPALRDGDVLPVGDDVGWPGGTDGTDGTDDTDGADVTDGAVVAPAREVTVGLRTGPRDDWFTAEALALLTATPWTVSPASNRVAARLAGSPSLARAVPGELPSEGLVLGAVQVPSDGRPLVFLADHPTTGGYPVIGVVETRDVPVVGQLRPGARLRFGLVC
jgi:biotin-dependent carboxylase-like uncharacterized protein